MASQESPNQKVSFQFTVEALYFFHDIVRTQQSKGGSFLSVTPCTVRQLHNAKQAHADDIFRIDGQELSHVSFFTYMVNFFLICIRSSYLVKLSI